jgi:fused signal recognition particle receptor
VNLQASLPSPLLPAHRDAAALSAYGTQLLQALAAQALPTDTGSAGQGLVEALARIALALQAAAPQALRRQVGWWGRLLGHDVARQAEAEALQSQLGVLLLQAHEQATRVRAQAVARDAVIEHAMQAAEALQAWSDAGSALLPDLGDAGAPLHEAFAQRLDHLRRLAALQRTEAGQWQLLLSQDHVLLARFDRIVDVLLPAWRQAALAHQARDQVEQASQAADLQEQIRAEVEAAHARLR